MGRGRENFGWELTKFPEDWRFFLQVLGEIKGAFLKDLTQNSDLVNNKLSIYQYLFIFLTPDSRSWNIQFLDQLEGFQAFSEQNGPPLNFEKVEKIF